MSPNNPWQVMDLEAFNFLCCPECVYRSKEDTHFQTHAVQNHPRSKVFFCQMPASQNYKIEDHVFYCCPECEFKSEKENTFKMHALENHPHSLSLFIKDSDSTKSSKSYKSY